MSLHKFAEQVAAHGRGDDSLLVHMTPDEVRNLQKFAEANGTTLTINPETGLPEAGLLSDLFKAVAPIALGAFLGPAGAAFGGGLMSAGMAGLTVGGITTLATGSLSRGLMAGLGAYGGAGLGESLMSAGTGAGMTEALAGSSTGNLGQAFGDVAATQGSSGQAFNEFLKSGANPATMTGAEAASAGLKAAASDPLAFAKNNLGNIAYAAAPIAAGMMVPTTTKLPDPKDTGLIRQMAFNINPDTGRPDPLYGMREMTPVKASEFGNKTFQGQRDLFYQQNQNQNPYQLGVASLNQPPQQPPRMAEGGIVALAGGGGVIRMAGGTPPAMLTDEQLYQKTGSWEAAAAARDDQNRALNIYNDAQRLAAATAPASTTAASTPAYFTQNPDVASAFAQNSYGMTPEAFAQTHYEKYGQAEGRSLPSAAANYAAANNIDLTKNINQWVADNPFATAAQVTAEAQKYGIADTDIQKALSANTNISDAARYALTHNMGLAGLQQGVLTALARNPNMTQAEIDAAQAQYGLSNYDIQSPLIHGYQVANDQTAAAQKYIQDNPDVARWINSDEGKAYLKANPQFDASDIAYTHYQRYGETEGRKWGLDKKPPPLPEPPVVLPPVVSPPVVTPTPDPFTSVVPSGFYGNATNPGDITTNKDGTVTVHPNIPYRPYGGFSGMSEVRNAYTKGGGSLGYTSPVVKTAAEHNALYNRQTDDSLDAYNYLMGKGKNLTQLKTLRSSPVMQRYDEAILGRKIGRPVAKTTTTDKKEVVAGDTAVIGGASFDLADPTQAPPEDNNGPWSWDVTSKRWVQYGKYADGGMTGYAVGGGLGSLGSYSDGGRLLKGPGDGVSDSIPATIGAKNQPARLADGEFVIPARIVSELGNGSTDAGAKKLYAMMDRVQKARGKTTGKNKVAANSRADKYLPA